MGAHGPVAVGASMQISTKVALSISLVVLVAGMAATLVAVAHQREERRKEVEQSNHQTLGLLALTVAPSIVENRHHRVQAVLDNVANFQNQYPYVENIEVLDTEGRIIAALDPRRFNEIIAAKQDGYIQHDLALNEPATRPGGDNVV
ncbi:MAG: hypothetical protein JRI68_09250, partial [Deltaproteobacteria bacterium]|nr:hypothetical protein [Deltaproteobacteria bacterium]